MAKEKKYKIVIDLNSQELNKQLSQAKTAIDKFTKNTQNNIKKTDIAWGSFVGNLGANAVTAALSAASRAMGDFVQESLTLASAAEEISNKFNVVFASVSKDADKAANDLASGYGLARSEAEKLLSNTGDLLTGFGFTGEAALKLSTEVNELAADLASFNNLPTEQASNAVTKALLGEREAIKSLGISILEVDVKKQVQINTAKGVTFATEREAKAYATLQLATKQSANAIGDFARSKNSAANVSRRLNARIHTLKEILGKQVLPAFTNAKLAVLKFLESLDENKVARFGRKMGALFDPNTYKIIGLNKELKNTRAKIEEYKTDIAIEKEDFFVNEKFIAKRLKEIEDLEKKASELENKLVKAATPKRKKEDPLKLEKEGEVTNLNQADVPTENIKLNKEKEFDAQLDAYRAERNALLADKKIEENEINLEELTGFEAEKIRIQQDAEEQLIALREKGKEKEAAINLSREKEKLALTQLYIKKQEQAEKNKARFDRQMASQRVGLVSATGDLINSIAGKQTKVGFALQQAAAIANVIINGIQASNAALAPPPLGLGPIAGAGLATTIGITTGVQAAAIAAQTIQGFSTGGVIADGNTSGDTTLIRANRKERVLTDEQNINYERGLNIIGQFSGGGVIAETLISIDRKIGDNDTFLDGEKITDNVNDRNARRLS